MATATLTPVLTELEQAALTHAIEVYTGPDDDTLPVLRGLLERRRPPIDRDELKAVIMSCGPDPAAAEVADAVVAHLTAVG